MVERRDINIILKNYIDWEYFRDKTVLVTGATGRLGMYIVEAISKANIDWNLNITILILARDEKKCVKVFKESLKFPYIHTIIQDIVKPIHWDGDIHYIFHLAGLASPMDFTYHPVETLWGHVMGTRNVMELAREKHSQKIFYVSTVESYGEWNKSSNIGENDMGILYCDNARACYPEAKRVCEAMLASYEAQYQIPYVVFRLSHTFGPGISLNDGRAFSEFLRDVIQNEDIVLQTDGSAMRTYTYVADAVGAMFVAITRGSDKLYNIANSENLISIRDLAKMIADLNANGMTKVRYAKPKNQQLKYLPFKLGVMDVSKITRLGWRPQVELKTALKYTLESFLQVN